jgi:translation initiation factor 2 beta subunit (eIF-2beta)/eIF-5
MYRNTEITAIKQRIRHYKKEFVAICYACTKTDTKQTQQENFILSVTHVKTERTERPKKEYTIFD